MHVSLPNKGTTDNLFPTAEAFWLYYAYFEHGLDITSARAQSYAQNLHS